MRLNKLTVGSFKNLQDFHIDFDTVSPYTVLVGENGAGKSNLLEALTLVFKSLDLELEAPFDFEIEYSCRDSDLAIRGKSGEHPTFRVRPSEHGRYRRLARRQFMDEDERGPLYRPAFVFGYYSGPGNRLASLYDKHRQRYYDWIIRPPERRGKREIADPNVLRRLFFAEHLHGQFALIAFFMEAEGDAGEDQKFLREHLMIDGLDCVLFDLKQPEWRRKGGDRRFWGAEGEVRDFLGRLYEQALLPMRLDRQVSRATGGTSSTEHLYLYLAGSEALEEVYATYESQYAFFTALESTDLSELLGEVRTRVRMTASAGGGGVTYRDLSEGEQQLLMVLGLLKFTARDESLFLLDEPDTHLNPAWSTRYLEFLNRFIQKPDSSHIVMATHDPLVFSSLERPQVRIVSRDESGKVAAEAPLNDPRGMGIQAILASDLFRLPSGGLDAPTVHELERQRELAQKDELTKDERSELAVIREHLRDRDFLAADRDPVYQLFLRHFLPRWLDRPEATAESDVEQLSVEEMRHREETAERIAQEIASEADRETAE